MKVQRALTILTVLVLGAASISAQTISGVDTGAILRQLDELQNFNNSDFAATVTIVADRPGEDQSVFKYRLSRQDALDRFLLVALDPNDIRGQGFLFIDDSLTFYDPESGKTQRVSLRDTLNDTEARNSDFQASSYAEDYRAVSVTPTTLGRFEVYEIDLEGLTDEVTFATKTIWVRRDNGLLLKEENYSVSGTLLRTDYIPRYIPLDGGKFWPAQIIQIDGVNPDERTQQTFEQVSTAALPASMFNPTYLETISNN